MGLNREPKNIDFTIQSEPWTEQELIDFRKLMAELKAKSLSKSKQISVRKPSRKKVEAKPLKKKKVLI